MHQDVKFKHICQSKGFCQSLPLEVWSKGSKCILTTKSGDVIHQYPVAFPFKMGLRPTEPLLPWCL